MRRGRKRVRRTGQFQKNQGGLDKVTLPGIKKGGGKVRGSKKRIYRRKKK